MKPIGLKTYDRKRQRAVLEVIIPGTGSRKRVRKVVNGNYEKVLDELKKFREKQLAMTTGTSLRAYVAREWNGSLSATLDPKTKVHQKGWLEKHILPLLGDCELSAISDAMLEDFVAQLRTMEREDGHRGYAPAYINTLLRLIRKIVRHAHRRNVIEHLPWRSPLPQLREAVLANELSREEERRFLRAFDDKKAFAAHLATHRHFGPTTHGRRHGASIKADSIAADYYFERFNALKPIFIIALNTGLRKSDLLSLTWDRIDFDDRIIHLVMRKTERDLIIPLSTAALSALRQLQKRSSHQYVMTTSEGRHLSTSTLLRAFTLAKNLAGITRRFRFHDLRHTFGSKLATANVSTRLIADCLGHTSTRMSERYTRPAPASRQVILAALG